MWFGGLLGTFLCHTWQCAYGFCQCYQAELGSCWRPVQTALAGDDVPSSNTLSDRVAQHDQKVYLSWEHRLRLAFIYIYTISGRPNIDHLWLCLCPYLGKDNINQKKSSHSVPANWSVAKWLINDCVVWWDDCVTKWLAFATQALNWSFYQFVNKWNMYNKDTYSTICENIYSFSRIHVCYSW